MTDSAAAVAASPQELDASKGGFKSFWKKSSKAAQAQNVTFVLQDPLHKKRSRLGKILNRTASSSSPEQDDGQGTKQTEARKRRDQVYQAQKRHRNRKSEYVHSLEAEVARLQRLDAQVNSEKNALAHENDAIRAFLASRSIDVQLDAVSLNPTTTTATTTTTTTTSKDPSLSQLGRADVAIRFDPDIGHDRLFCDALSSETSDSAWTSSDMTDQSDRTTTRHARGAAAAPPRHAPVLGDSAAALDFILALEWPCKDHVRHHAINPSVPAHHHSDADAREEITGHTLTMMSAVFQSAQAPAGGVKTNGATTTTTTTTTTGLNWQLPHSEIDKLVALSEDLELDDESLTPAQAYSALRETVPSAEFLRPALELLKKPLAELVACCAFGASLDATKFWDHVEGAIQSLEFTRPDLIQDAGAPF